MKIASMVASHYDANELAAAPPRLRSTSLSDANKSRRVAHFRNYLYGGPFLPIAVANNWRWRRPFLMENDPMLISDEKRPLKNAVGWRIIIRQSQLQEWSIGTVSFVIVRMVFAPFTIAATRLWYPSPKNSHSTRIACILATIFAHVVHSPSHDLSTVDNYQ